MTGSNHQANQGLLNRLLDEARIRSQSTRDTLRDIVQVILTREDIISMCSVPGVTPFVSFEGPIFGYLEGYRIYFRKFLDLTTTVTLVDQHGQTVVEYQYLDEEFD